MLHSNTTLFITMHKQSKLNRRTMFKLAAHNATDKTDIDTKQRTVTFNLGKQFHNFK